MFSQNTKVFYTPEEITVWQDRAVNGPYKTAGDAGVNSPGDWDRIISNAADFLADDFIYYYGSLDPEPHYTALNIKDAAFVTLIKDTSIYIDKIKESLLNQIAIPEVDFTTWEYLGDQAGFAVVDWVIRLFYTYGYTYSYFSESERNALNEWFYNAAVYFANNVHNDLRKNFPNRLYGDYSIVDRDAESGGFNEGEITHLNKNGEEGNQIYWLHKWYNNRRSSQIKISGLVGAFLQDSVLVNHAKVFVKEMLKYGVFPDGTMGEYERNGDWGNPQQGMIYSTVNIETCVLIADALARIGDFELFEYSTTDGLWGTEGGIKDIKLMIDNYYKQVTLEHERYYDTVLVQNRIDNINEVDNIHWVNDCWYSKANLYYQNSYFNEVFTRDHPLTPSFPSNGLGTSGPIATPWGGSGFTHPGYLFMYADLGGVIWPYPDGDVD